MCFFALLGFSFLLKNSGGFNYSKNKFIDSSSIVEKIVQKLKASNLYQNQERQKVSEPSVIDRLPLSMAGSTKEGILAVETGWTSPTHPRFFSCQRLETIK